MYGPFAPVEAIYETAAAAEEVGFDSYWLGDRIIGFPEPPVVEAWSALAALAVRTSRIRLGMSVTDAYRRPPAVLAQMVAAIDQISGGRVIPGVGAGERVNLEPFGIRMEGGAERVEEYVTLLKRYWSGERVDFEGRFYRSTGGLVQPKPVQQPHPPVLVAANARKTLEVVGRSGDAWLSAAKSPAMVREDLAVVRAAAASAGRSPSGIEPTLFTYCVVHSDADYARKVAYEFGGSILLWWRGSLSRLGVRAGARDLTISNWDGTEDTVQRWLAGGGQVSREAVDQLINHGTAETVARRVQAFVEAGVRHFVFVCLDAFTDVPRWKDSARIIGEQVLPAVRSEAIERQ